jgi:hypothetical protein
LESNPTDRRLDVKKRFSDEQIIGFKRSASTSFLGEVAAQPNSSGKFGQDFLRTVFDRIRKKGVLRWASILGKVGRPR